MGENGLGKKVLNTERLANYGVYCLYVAFACGSLDIALCIVWVTVFIICSI